MTNTIKRDIALAIAEERADNDYKHYRPAPSTPQQIVGWAKETLQEHKDQAEGKADSSSRTITVKNYKHKTDSNQEYTQITIDHDTDDETNITLITIHTVTEEWEEDSKQVTQTIKCYQDEEQWCHTLKSIATGETEESLKIWIQDTMLTYDESGDHQTVGDNDEDWLLNRHWDEEDSLPKHSNIPRAQALQLQWNLKSEATHIHIDTTTLTVTVDSAPNSGLTLGETAVLAKEIERAHDKALEIQYILQEIEPKD